MVLVSGVDDISWLIEGLGNVGIWRWSSERVHVVKCTHMYLTA